MPRFLETKLRSEYKAKGKTGRALDRAVYGTLNATGMMHGNVETAKGKAADVKHDAKLHPKMAARGKAIQAAHRHLHKTVPGFARLSTKERFKRAHAHVDRTR